MADILIRESRAVGSGVGDDIGKARSQTQSKWEGAIEQTFPVSPFATATKPLPRARIGARDSGALTIN